ncbi:uncharacterized protein PHACADRAFT_265815 [Phanerochaete carnosa HHB-10118-sp]|uniref:Uncharacterized protein n=1 Tax=Phanerochaete carnosa (strain HHB-10118-sp) TaxID=650164 RepID=K5VQV3_PHACS|nr:uncharacterized protein PHACADRAFT_265815 [Phanerochaete carnosa HHB-10118-sp]EKM49125.1 hypothetical protein PHACADRAFT_265815 [Phanerochaete carnosa HHB-10118-sp]
MSLSRCIDKYGCEDKIRPGGRVEGPVECLAGHIHSIRASNQCLRSYDLHVEGRKV